MSVIIPGLMTLINDIDILCRRGPLPSGRGIAGQVGAEREASLGGLQQSQARREGQLLLGGVPGDRRGRMVGTGGEQQRGKLRGFPEPVAGTARRAAQRDLGQCAGAPGSGDTIIPGDPWPEPAAGEPPFSRGQALPGYSPDFNAGEAI